MRRVRAILTVGLVVATASWAAAAYAASHQPGAGSVSITRDGAGIPHIVASNFTALGLGEGYALAQATDPTSPWNASMTRLYSRQRWVNLPYTAAALARNRPRAPLVLSVR